MTCTKKQWEGLPFQTRKRVMDHVIGSTVEDWVVEDAWDMFGEILEWNVKVLRSDNSYRVLLFNCLYIK